MKKIKNITFQPALVMAQLKPSEITLVIRPGRLEFGTVDGRGMEETETFPVELVPIELRAPNTEVWIGFKPNGIDVEILPRRGEEYPEQYEDASFHRRQGDKAMKVIELQIGHPTLDEAMGFAKDEMVVLRRSDGSVFALSQLDDFDVEVELLKNNPGFMSFLRRLSQEKATISLQELRKELE